MKINALGHVVVRVTDLARAEKFYGDLLGLPIIARYDANGLKMTFFTLGNHHDFAVMQVSGEGSSTSENAVGLHHFNAVRIAHGLFDLVVCQARTNLLRQIRQLDSKRGGFSHVLL